MPFGAKAASAIVNYLRERRKHRFADVDELFIGQRGPLSYHAAYRIVSKRAQFFRLLAFEIKQHLLRKRICQTKCHEIGSTFAFDVRQISTGVCACA